MRIFTVSKVLLLVLLSYFVTQAALGKRPNVVVLLADDLGYRDVGCYDGPVETPVIDRLAAQGMRFTDFYSGAAVCSPARAILLTGRHHIRAGVYSWIENKKHRAHLLERETTLAELLRDRGYATAHFGKWHLGLPTPELDKPGLSEHGFDYWFMTEKNAIPSHRNPRNFVRNGVALGEIEGYSCQIVVDEAIDWLENVRSDESPFFLNVWFHEPHEPLAAPDDIVRQYGELDERAAVYSGTIDNMDRAIGRLLETLARVAPVEDTLIVFASDNGSYLPERSGELRGVKGSNWEGGVRVPGIFYWPGAIAPGQVQATPAGLVDLLPTIAGFAGIGVPEGMALDGADIGAVLTSKEAPLEREQPLFWYLTKSRPIMALRSEQWVVTADPDREIPRQNFFEEAWIPLLKETGYTNFQLFDVVDDPGQQHDVSGRNPEVFARLKAELLRISASVVKEGPDYHAVSNE